MTTKNTFLTIFSLALVAALDMTGTAGQSALSNTPITFNLMASSDQPVEVAERGSGRLDGGDSTSLSIQVYQAS